MSVAGLSRSETVSISVFSTEQASVDYFSKLTNHSCWSNYCHLARALFHVKFLSLLLMTFIMFSLSFVEKFLFDPPWPYLNTSLDKYEIEEECITYLDGPNCQFYSIYIYLEETFFYATLFFSIVGTLNVVLTCVKRSIYEKWKSLDMTFYILMGLSFVGTGLILLFSSWFMFYACKDHEMRIQLNLKRSPIDINRSPEHHKLNSTVIGKAVIGIVTLSIGIATVHNAWILMYHKDLEPPKEEFILVPPPLRPPFTGGSRSQNFSGMSAISRARTSQFNQNQHDQNQSLIDLGEEEDGHQFQSQAEGGDLTDEEIELMSTSTGTGTEFTSNSTSTSSKQSNAPQQKKSVRIETPSMAIHSPRGNNENERKEDQI